MAVTPSYWENRGGEKLEVEDQTMQHSEEIRAQGGSSRMASAVNIDCNALKIISHIHELDKSSWMSSNTDCFSLDCNSFQPCGGKNGSQLQAHWGVSWPGVCFCTFKCLRVQKCTGESTRWQIHLFALAPGCDFSSLLDSWVRNQIP